MFTLTSVNKALQAVSINCGFGTVQFFKREQTNSSTINTVSALAHVNLQNIQPIISKMYSDKIGIRF